MKTNFFENIASLQTPGIWKLVIETDANGNFTVSELFTTTCGDKAVNRIIPFSLNGTAQDLDEGFFSKITEPIIKSAGLQTNMEAHLKSVEEARLASKMEQDKKVKAIKPKTEAKSVETDEDIEVGEAKPNKEEKKKAYDEAMKKIAEHNDRCQYGEALALLPSAEDYPEKKAELEKKHSDLTRKKEQHDKMLQLF
jgi:PRTRC genetic system protein E